MLVCPDDGGIDHHMLEVWVLRQDLEKILPNAFAGPTIETDEHAIPVAKRAWQITPGRARAQKSKAQHPRTAGCPRRFDLYRPSYPEPNSRYAPTAHSSVRAESRSPPSSCDLESQRRTVE